MSYVGRIISIYIYIYIYCLCLCDKQNEISRDGYISVTGRLTSELLELICRHEAIETRDQYRDSCCCRPIHGSWRDWLQHNRNWKIGRVFGIFLKIKLTQKEYFEILCKILKRNYWLHVFAISSRGLLITLSINDLYVLLSRVFLTWH